MKLPVMIWISGMEGASLVSLAVQERDKHIKEVLAGAGKSWCGVPGCRRCQEEYQKYLKEVGHDSETVH